MLLSRPNRFRCVGRNGRRRFLQSGFTLLELAIALVIIGLLAGGGLAIYTSISDHAKREETAQYLETVRRSLLIYANLKGRLPRADAGTDGVEDGAGVKIGELPFKDIGVMPLDAWGRRLKYSVNARLTTDKNTGCDELKKMIQKTAVPENSPKVWEATGGGGAANPLRFVVVIVSAGPRDADGDGHVFDGSYDIGPPESGGQNQTADPYAGPPFLRRKPEYSSSVKFDDLVIYIGAPTLYDWMRCTN